MLSDAKRCQELKPLKPSSENTEYILKNLEAIGPVEVGRFFGGVGLSNGFVQFAMIMGNSLYFATDENSRKNTNKQECSRFRI